MSNLRDGLYGLLSAVELDTKEHGRARVQPMLSQRLIMDAVADGLENGVHEFVILKSRQMGATSVCSVIELFWSLANPGTQGAIIADRTDNLERLRRIFATLLETLPREWRGPDHRIVQNNRTGIAFANRSVIDLMAAGSNPDLGASRALNMCHMTECSLWKSRAGVESLKASLARENPTRLYLWESIANGLGNWFYNFCQQAKEDRHMRFVFLGFWSNDTYQIQKDDPDFDVYMPRERGRYRFTEDEITRARYVKQHYGVTVTPEQIAWYRRESEYRAEEHMLRHYPWHERECFIASGSGFFPAQRTLEIAEAVQTCAPYKGYKYHFQDQFLASRIEQTTDPEEAQLRVWEPPQNAWIEGGRDEQGQLLPNKPPGVYVIGIDPSGGGGGDSDDHAIEVFRAYADRLVQIAEYQSNKPYTYQLAWVLAHLAGAYRDHLAILEVTGIGAAVKPEVRNLRQMAMRGLIQAEPGGDPILQMIGAVRWFLYKRPDTMSGGGNVTDWKTNHDNKRQIYSEFRDSMMKGCIEIRSAALADQLQGIVEDEGWIGAGPDTDNNDDLAYAAVMAHHAWNEAVAPRLIARKMTWRSVNEVPPPMNDPASRFSWAFSQAYSDHMLKMNRNGQRRQRF